MTGLLARRLARLEQTASPAETVHVWGGSETLVETIAQRFPEGAPGGVRPTFDSAFSASN